jgi:hypothetical protein
MEVALKGDKLVISVDVGEAALRAAAPSSTGKTRTVATTHGFRDVNGNKNGLRVSVNVTVPNQ